MTGPSKMLSGHKMRDASINGVFPLLAKAEWKKFNDGNISVIEMLTVMDGYGDEFPSHNLVMVQQLIVGLRGRWGILSKSQAEEAREIIFRMIDKLAIHVVIEPQHGDLQKDIKDAIAIRKAMKPVLKRTQAYLYLDAGMPVKAISKRMEVSLNWVLARNADSNEEREAGKLGLGRMANGRKPAFTTSETIAWVAQHIRGIPPFGDVRWKAKHVHESLEQRFETTFSRATAAEIFRKAQLVNRNKDSPDSTGENPI